MPVLIHRKSRNAFTCCVSFTSVRLIFLPVFILFAFNCYAQSQDQFKLMAYNLLNYPEQTSFSADTSLRNPYFRTSIAAAAPDILVTEEMNSQAGVNGFLSNVMN